MSARHRLGSWRCPSGNTVDVFLLNPGDGSSIRHVALEWDSPPPLSPVDEAYYIGVVLPQLTRRAQEYLERPGRALVVRL